MDLEKLYNTITCNGSRKMTLERFKQAVAELLDYYEMEKEKKEYETKYLINNME